MATSEAYNLKILIAEAGTVRPFNLHNHLSDLEHRMVGQATSGEEAIAYTAQLHPDMVLVGLNLKGELGGLETARMIQQYMRIPVVMMASGAEADLVHVQQQNSDMEWLTDPVGRDRLKFAIKRAWESMRPYRQGLV